jgi:hypothetical protein
MNGEYRLRAGGDLITDGFSVIVIKMSQQDVKDALMPLRRHYMERIGDNLDEGL